MLNSFCSKKTQGASVREKQPTVLQDIKGRKVSFKTSPKEERNLMRKEKADIGGKVGPTHDLSRVHTTRHMDEYLWDTWWSIFLECFTSLVNTLWDIRVYDMGVILIFIFWYFYNKALLSMVFSVILESQSGALLECWLKSSKRA